MRLNRVNSAIDRNERNKLNENFDIIERGQSSIQNQINQLVIEGDSSVEAAQARVSTDDTVYDTLKMRLDTEKTQVNQQLLTRGLNVKDPIGTNLAPVPNDGSDVSAQLKAIVEYANENSIGSIFFPPGEYLIDTSITDFYFNGVRNIEFVGSGDSVIKLRRGSLLFANVSNIKFTNITFKTDKNYITANGLNSPVIRFTNFKDIHFNQCVFNEWGIGTEGVSGGEILQFVALEEGTTPGDVAGSSEGVYINDCSFDGGKLDTQFAIRCYTEYLKDNGTYVLTNSLKDIFITNCIFKGFNWQAIEFVGANTFNGHVKNCNFYNNGITWAEADKGSHDITFSHCLVDGLSGSVEGQLARGISIQGHYLEEIPFYRKSENIIIDSCIIKNISARGAGIYMDRVGNSKIINCDIQCNTRYTFSHGIEIRQHVDRNRIENVKLTNFHYGITETTPRVNNMDVGTIKNVEFIGTLKGPIINLYQGSKDRPDLNTGIVGLFENIKGTSDLTDTSPTHILDITNPSLIQILSTPTLTSPIFKDCEFRISGTIPTSGLVTGDLYKISFINLITNIPNLVPSSYDSTTLKRLVIENATSEALYLHNFLDKMATDCYIYGKHSNSSNGKLYSNVKPANGLYLTNQEVVNTIPTAGGFLGWVRIGSTFKGYGLIET